jgi:hypothetical protein
VKSRIPSISAACLSFSLLLVPYKQAVSNHEKDASVVPFSKEASGKDPIAIEQLREEADVMYDSIQLAQAGLKREAFEYAWQGYHALLEKNLVQKTGIITICDFSQSSRSKRMYLIDVENYKLLMQTHVAHGRNSGREYATHFSNLAKSHQSSLGFYITRDTYWGGHGLALKIDGLEPGINDQAERRNIVVHGSKYVGADYLQFKKYIGRSFGCPAIPSRQTNTIINMIKNGTCFFIYHPTKKYIEASKILNG